MRSINEIARRDTIVLTNVSIEAMRETLKEISGISPQLAANAREH